MILLKRPRVFLRPANEVWGKVMFLHLFDSHSLQRGGLHPGGGLGRPPSRILRDTVNERAVHILLECSLVKVTFYSPCPLFLLLSSEYDRMNPSLILAIIYTITIGTMLNNNGSNNGHRLKMLRVN